MSEPHSRVVVGRRRREAISCLLKATLAVNWLLQIDSDPLGCEYKVILCCAMAYAVSRQSLTSESRFRSNASPCGICGGENGMGQVFVRVFRFSLVRIHISVLCTHTVICHRCYIILQICQVVR